MKLFTSAFAQTMGDLGIGGYDVDVESVMKALRVYQTRDKKRFEQTLQEYDELRKKYANDLFVWTGAFRGSGKSATPIMQPGARTMYPHDTIMMQIFEYTHGDDPSVTKDLKFEATMLHADWVNAHVNHVLNSIYHLALPEIDRFLLVNYGRIYKCIDVIYGGRNVENADEQYQAALISFEREHKRVPNQVEREEIQRRFYKTGEAVLEEKRQQLLDEFKNEWNEFIEKDVDDILERGK